MREPIIKDGGPMPAWMEGLMYKQAREAREAAARIQAQPAPSELDSEPEIVAGLPVPEPHPVELPLVESNEDAFDRRLMSMLPHNQVVERAPLMVSRAPIGLRRGKAMLVYQTVRRLDSWVLPHGVVLEARVRMVGRWQFLLVAGQVATIEEIGGLSWVRLEPIPERQRRDVIREVWLTLDLKIPLYFWPNKDSAHNLRGLWPENILRQVDMEPALRS